MSKIQPNGIRPGGSQFGTTIEHSDPAKFRNTGSSQKKKGSGGDTIHQGPHGTTFVENSSHVSMPHADMRPKTTKDIGATRPKFETSKSETAGEQTASKSGSEGPTQRKYPLSRGYEKSGKSDKKTHKIY
jgi:hypothetical protein